MVTLIVLTVYFFVQLMLQKNIFLNDFEKKHLTFHTVFFIIEEIYDTNSHVKSIQLLHGFIKKYFTIFCSQVCTLSTGEHCML